MRTTIALDDELVEVAQELTGVTEKTALVREALKALIQRESAQRLADLGGKSPKMTAARVVDLHDPGGHLGLGGPLPLW